MNKKLIALAALLPCLALAGCVSTTPNRNPSFATVAPVAPTPTADPAKPIADGIVDTVWIQVFGGTTFKSKHGCKCTLPNTTTELFPTGTPVLFLKVTMTGEWKPSQGNQTTQDVTGTSLTGTQFDGRPDRPSSTPPTAPPQPRPQDFAGSRPVYSTVRPTGPSRTIGNAPSPPRTTSRPASTGSSSPSMCRRKVSPTCCS